MSIGTDPSTTSGIIRPSTTPSRASVRQSIAIRRLSKRDSARMSYVETTLLDKRLCEVFDVFDSGKVEQIDVRELGTILRALGCVVTEAELQEIQVEVEDVASNSVSLTRFLEYMTKTINERKFKPAEPEKLLEAFQLLDPENRGYIMRDVLEKAMMEIGEPFSKEEINDMMVIACDPETKRINYEHYINLLTVKIPDELNVYSIVAEMERIKLESMPKKRRLESLLMSFQQT